MYLQGFPRTVKEVLIKGEKYLFLKIQNVRFDILLRLKWVNFLQTPFSSWNQRKGHRRPFTNLTMLQYIIEWIYNKLVEKYLLNDLWTDDKNPFNGLQIVTVDSELCSTELQYTNQNIPILRESYKGSKMKFVQIEIKNSTVLCHMKKNWEIRFDFFENFVKWFRISESGSSTRLQII